MSSKNDREFKQKKSKAVPTFESRKKRAKHKEFLDKRDESINQLNEYESLNVYSQS